MRVLSFPISMPEGAIAYHRNHGVVRVLSIDCHQRLVSDSNHAEVLVRVAELESLNVAKDFALGYNHPNIECSIVPQWQGLLRYGEDVQ